LAHALRKFFDLVRDQQTYRWPDTAAISFDEALCSASRRIKALRRPADRGLALIVISRNCSQNPAPR
jgi:hypothetical protein